MAKRMTLKRRFWSKVNMYGPVCDNGYANGHCWEWKGAKQKLMGYGLIEVKPKLLKAHRVSYGLIFGIFPQDMLVCHKCDNPSCVRPSHLFLGTHQDNMDDCMRKGRDFKIPAFYGEDASGAKLTEAQARHIIIQYHEGMTPLELSHLYSVSRGAIYGLLRCETWKLLDREKLILSLYDVWI